MIDVRAAIDEVRIQAEDEAYWNALEKILGRVTARTLRATLRAKVRGNGSTERERVSRGLSELLAVPSRFVNDLAKTKADAQGPHPREDALRDLGLHEHWIDFSEPSEEAGRTIPFVERGLARGAQVVALIPSDRLDDYRRTISRADHADDLEDGRMAIHPTDQLVDKLRTAGVLAVVLLAMQGFIQTARGQGFEEVWFVSKIAPSLLAPTAPNFDIVLRLEAALDDLIQSLPISILCPFPTMLPGTRLMFSNLIHANTWASVADEALDLRSMGA